MTALLCFLLVAAEPPLATYPGATSTRIGDEMLIGGEPYRMAYFLTDDPIAAVAEHFEREWKDAGYPVTAASHGEERVVSAFLTREGLVKSIVLRRHQGRTLGFSVLKDAWEQPRVARGDPLPKLEGALQGRDVAAVGPEGATVHRSMRVDAPLQQVRDRHEATWIKAGWRRIGQRRLERDERGSSRHVIEYARGREQAIVTLVDVDGQACAIDEIWFGGAK